MSKRSRLIIYSLCMAFFTKPKYIRNKSTKYKVDIRFHHVIRWYNPFCWPLMFLFLLYDGIRNTIEDYNNTGPVYTIEFIFKKDTTWLQRWWTKFIIIYGKCD